MSSLGPERGRTTPAFPVAVNWFDSSGKPAHATLERIEERAQAMRSGSGPGSTAERRCRGIGGVAMTLEQLEQLEGILTAEVRWWEDLDDLAISFSLVR